MDIISIGVFDLDQKQSLNKIISKIPNINIVWEYEEYNINSFDGIEVLKEYFNIYSVGILVEDLNETPFSSYTLIYEVTEFYLEEIKKPSLFNLIDLLEKESFPQFVMTFADNWDNNTLIRHEYLDYNQIKSRLNTIYVWCETYVDMKNNEEIRSDKFPLVIELKANITGASL